ncbi:phosphoenolpyruvate synthase [Altericroceibacterium spongiae]|uniref:Phosphoenolpyruvate synthase n=1 Tax=Altericroceibacterium spongiae TaxID=2320269 RepID=A0A420ECJ6_9SPHN|nr:phosphoenolpyruvate synthase [Altericroceibacterium spongiae]
MDRPVAWFADIGLADRPAVGGKGGSLGELTQAGIPVPPGFVVTTHGFELFLEAMEHHRPVRGLVADLAPDDLDTIRSVSQELRHRVEQEPLPATVRKAVEEAYARLGSGDEAVAVRSSATTEDADDASFAGLQDTFLWVMNTEEMFARLRECWGSLYSVESIAYRRKHSLPEDNVAMAVVVQQMVDARSAGVMFTRSPTSGDKSVITIEGAWGLGSSVVSGEVTPDRWVIGKITGDIATRDISDKHAMQIQAEGGGIREVELEAKQRTTPCLNDEELLALRDIGRRVERHYGKPQDIEWAISQSGQILLLQSRPETVWAMRDATKPVKPPESNPLKHVMTIFGGTQ